MATYEDYTSGTVSIANGSTALTGAGTAWLTAGLKAGDEFWQGGYAVVIASVDSETAITLKDAWPGATLSGAAYLIRFQQDGSRVQGTTRNLLDQLSVGFSLVGTSTTSLAIATGSKTFTIKEDNRGWGVGQRLRAASDADGSNYMEGVITAYTANSLTLNVDLVGGTGTFADWTISLAGEPGSDADVAVATHAATSKTTPVDADELPIADSAAAFGLKKLTWASVKATLKTYFDALYYRSGNILGTVSQSGGVPTGAIIERGSNANGQYVRYADGTQICTNRVSMSVAVTTALGSFFYGPSSGYTWTFPSAFVAGSFPVLNATARMGGQMSWTSMLDTVSNPTAGGIIINNATSQTGTFDIRMVAVGRWF